MCVCVGFMSRDRGWLCHVTESMQIRRSCFPWGRGVMWGACHVTLEEGAHLGQQCLATSRGTREKYSSRRGETKLGKLIGVSYRSLQGGREGEGGGKKVKKK